MNNVRYLRVASHTGSCSGNRRMGRERASNSAGLRRIPPGATGLARVRGAPENNHYSALAQINRNNVKRLAVAWSFDTGEDGVLQSSPIVVAGVLYGLTPTQKVFALDAATGKLLWNSTRGYAEPTGSRLAYWADGKDTTNSR